MSLSDPKEVLQSVEGMLESAQTILLCSAHQRRIVDDILTYSKLDSSLLNMTPVLINPLEIVKLVTQMFKNEAVASDIELDSVCHSSFESLQTKVFHGDPTRITQVVVNLVSNIESKQNSVQASQIGMSGLRLTTLTFPVHQNIPQQTHNSSTTRLQHRTSTNQHGRRAVVSQRLCPRRRHQSEGTRHGGSSIPSHVCCGYRQGHDGGGNVEIV